jgi:transcriptional regulator with XRE-family HTH domain
MKESEVMMEEETAMREKFAEVLREMRQASGMTQEQLAARIGKTKQAVSRYENGAYYPAMPVIREIAEVCGYAMGEVFDLAAKKLGVDTSAVDATITFLRNEVEGGHQVLNEIEVTSVGENGEPLTLTERIRIALKR